MGMVGMMMMRMAGCGVGLVETFAFGFFPVEVAVAIAGRTFEGFQGSFFSSCHELPTPVHGMPTYGHSMILLAFSEPV